MQETQSIGGGRFFGGGGGGGGDRRLRHHHHLNHHQALKCPRCDSLNTKFCYYNNYNLSQPRFFCKNCRRYWTKGGVLRNVPVGGGCRKSKRASHNNKPPKNSSSETETTAPPERNSNSHSSSESSSLTATTTTEAVSAPNTFNSDSNNNDESMLLIPSSNPSLETGALEQQQQGTGDSTIFSEIGSFTCLITSTNDTLQFGIGGNTEKFVNEVRPIVPISFPEAITATIPDSTPFQWQHQKGLSTLTGDDGELKFQDNLNGCNASMLDRGTLPVDLSGMQNKTGHGGFGSLDWLGGGDHGLCDLSDTVDHTYWTPHTTHWSDHDNSTLFHLP